jgi:hypothetical protein
VKQLAYLATPVSRIYALKENSDIACLTIRPDTSVRGWSNWPCPAGDAIICIAARVPQGDGEDELWAITDRGGSRYLEKLSTGTLLDHQIPWSGASGNTVTGLSSLEGRTVQILSGTYRGEYAVSGGQVAGVSGAAFTTATAGLPIQATVTGYRPETSDRVAGDTPGRKRLITAGRVHLNASLGESTAGGSELIAATETVAVTGWRDVPAVAEGDGADADLAIVQNRPFPFEVLAVSTEVRWGGS